MYSYILASLQIDDYQLDDSSMQNKYGLYYVNAGTPRLLKCTHKPNAAIMIVGRPIPNPAPIAILSLLLKTFPDWLALTTTVDVEGSSVEMVLKGVVNTVMLVSVFVDELDEAVAFVVCALVVVAVGSCCVGGRAVVVPSRLEVHQNHASASNQRQYSNQRRRYHAAEMNIIP
jgi:hypothetical protein